jgi:DNA (cytosine-5)-methyltransferase 1
MPAPNARRDLQLDLTPPQFRGRISEIHSDLATVQRHGYVHLLRHGVACVVASTRQSRRAPTKAQRPMRLLRSTATLSPRVTSPDRSTSATTCVPATAIHDAGADGRGQAPALFQRHQLMRVTRTRLAQSRGWWDRSPRDPAVPRRIPNGLCHDILVDFRTTNREASTRVIGIDLFSGAGGLSLGATLAGIDVRLAVERDRHAAATYSRNHRSTSVLVSDVLDFDPRRFALPRRGVVLFGGPPCQGFSTSNQRTRNGQNDANWLFREFLRITSIWMPDAVVVENVRGILETEHGLFVRLITEGLADLCYDVSVHTLNAADFGVPQVRSRVFIIGTRKRVQLRIRGNVGRHVTVRAALHDLPELRNGSTHNALPYRGPAKTAYARRMRSGANECGNHLVTRNADEIVRRYSYIGPGGNWQSIPPEHRGFDVTGRGPHTGLYYRLKLDEPARVIGNFRKNMLIHPTADRGLSIREAARLQSFPDTYEFTGTIGFQQQQVGNAVPPLLAAAVFGALTRAL